MEKLKFKKNNWINLKTNKYTYGIDVKKEDDTKWMHLAIDGRPYFARKEERRDEKLKKLIKENK